MPATGALVGSEFPDLAAFDEDGRAPDGGSDEAAAMRGQVLDPLALVARNLAQRSILAVAQQAAIVAAAYEAVAGRIGDQRQHGAAVARGRHGRQLGAERGGQQAHAPVAQGESNERSVVVEGARGDRCLAGDRTRRRQALGPHRTGEIELHAARQSSKPRCRFAPSRLRPMKTSLLDRFSPSFQGVPQSLSIIMWTPW